MWAIIKLIFTVFMLVLIYRFIGQAWDVINTIEFNIDKKTIQKKYEGYIIVDKGGADSMIIQADSTRRYLVLLDDIIRDAYSVGDTIKAPEDTRGYIY